MSVRGVRILLLAATVVAVLTAVGYTTVAGAVGYITAYAAVCGLAWWAALRVAAERDRGPWLLIAVAQSLWLAGDLIELVQYYTAEVPAVGPADVCWLAGYPLVAAALTLMARRRAPGRLRGAVLDALTLTVAAGLATWQFLIAPLFGEGYPLLEMVVPALYPVGDVVLLAGVLVVALSPGKRGTPTRLLLASVMLYLAVDLGYNLLPYVLDYGLVERIAPGILLGNALLVGAALHPRRAELTRSGHQVPSMHPARVLFLGVALMTAPTLTLRHYGFGREGVVALLATALCAVLVLTRFTIAVREQEAAQRQLAYQARHDPLTGLANRTSFADQLARTLPSTGGQAALLYLDLDGFKEINDTYGHDAGDAVLVAVANRLATVVRGSDVVARLGGDEFVVLCPGVATSDAVALADRILTETALPVPFREHLLTVGVSIGIAAHAGAPTGSPATVLRAADAAMYAAKRRGGGQRVLAEPDGAPEVPAPVPTAA